MVKVYLSTTFGIPLWLIMRMMYNITVDFIFTLVPLLGGFLHMFYKANLYNYEELCDWLNNSTDKNTQRVKPDERKAGEITWTQLGKDVTQKAAKILNDTRKSMIEQKKMMKKKPQ
jgi:hypothetical protein